jgi:hypothetical protein
MNVVRNAMVLGNYPTLGQVPTLGQDSSSGMLIDPTLMWAGIGVLAFGMFFLGGRVEPQRRFRGRKAERLRKEISDRQERLKGLL